MKNYKYYEVITCRLAIRVCIGYGPNGRKKHRTFSMKNINPNASWEGIMKVIHALAPVLEFPIVDVQKVTSKKIIFYEDAEPVTPSVALSVPMKDEFTHAEPEFLPELPDPLDLEIAIWEELARKEQEKFALALFMYTLWAWNLSRLQIGMGRAPPVA